MRTHHYIAPQADIDILYQDDALLVVNKPAGLLTVPGNTPEKQDCLIHRVQQDFPDALIVHRLDMSTSGVLILGRGKDAHRELSKQFEQRKVNKEYIAIVGGQLKNEEGEINMPIIADWPKRPKQKIDFILGRPSLTRYRVIEYYPQTDTSRVALFPVTGRSHQLRLHLETIGHAILGDEIYANDAIYQKADRLLLHAQMISFTHPFTGETITVKHEADF